MASLRKSSQRKKSQYVDATNKYVNLFRGSSQFGHFDQFPSFEYQRNEA